MVEYRKCALGTNSSLPAYPTTKTNRVGLFIRWGSPLCLNHLRSVILRLGHELCVAVMGAEVVGLPLVLRMRGRRVRVDVHSTYEIFDGNQVFLLIWFVFLYVKDCLIIVP